MVSLPTTLSCPVSRGVTQDGEVIFIVAWCDIEPLSQQTGDRIRAYCPIHHSDHQRSLSINTKNGWGNCFSLRCQARVLVRDFNPLMAACLVQRMQQGPSLPVQPRPVIHKASPAKLSRADWQTEEYRLLAALQAEGALRLDREVAWNAQAYLEARHIPVDLAIAAGVGYLEPGANVLHGHRFLQRWEDRLLFPLAPPALAQDTHGFAGRLIWHWQCCPDETAHKHYLEQRDRKRWIKTNPAGWFWEPHHLPASDPLVIVEGPFDRLAVLAEGRFHAEEVVALVGTALQPEWLANTHAVLLALDSDQGGKEATKRITQHLTRNHVMVEACQPPVDDAGGKDWSERWRKSGSQGLDALYSYHALLAHGV